MAAKTDPAKIAALSEIFKTCNDMSTADDVQNLYTHLQNGYLYLAMTDYPYETSFLQPLPANPVVESCKAYKDIEPQPAPGDDKEEILGDSPFTDREQQVLAALKASSDVYFNWTSVETCTNIDDTDATGALDGAGWNVLACNELAMPCSMGKDSMFIEEPFDYAAYTQMCQSTYGLTPNYQWALDYFGGYNYTRDFQFYSNIIFSNGELDPWRAGGVYSFVNFDLPHYVIEGGAHHLDLRLPNDADKGTDVEWVR